MHNIINKAAMFFCRIGIAGLAPRAPGTFGSLAALIMAPWLFLPFSLEVQISLLVIIFFLGGVAATRAELFHPFHNHHMRHRRPIAAGAGGLVFGRPIASLRRRK